MTPRSWTPWAIAAALLMPLPAAGDPADAPGENYRLVFGSARSGNGDLYALDLVTGRLDPVVTTPAGEGGARYDAARGRLLHQRHGDAEDGTWIVHGDVRLFPDPNGDNAPVWRPTGEHIAYTARGADGGEGLFVASPDGTAPRPVVTGLAVNRYPTWSPDGRRIAVAGRGEAGWDIYIVEPFETGAPVTRLTRDGVYVGHLAWSPDGAAIAFDTLVEGQAEIALVEVASGAVRRLTNRDGNDLVPAWSPDGRFVAFAGDAEGTGNFDVWLHELASGQSRKLTNDPAWDGAPVFVPAAVLVAPRAGASR